MKVHTYEIVKEFVFWPEDVDQAVKGRICRTLDSSSAYPYRWEISHHYKPSEDAGVYHPSKVSCRTQDEAEQLLRIYAEAFTGIAVEENLRY